MARLPQPGGDSGNWGVILNQYLQVAHTDAGIFKDNSITAAHIAVGAVVTSHLVSASVTDQKLSSTIVSSVSSAVKQNQRGIAGGMATLDINGKIPTSQLPAENSQDQTVADASAISKGLLQLTGDLVGLAQAPMVYGVNGVAITGTPASGEILLASSGTTAEWGVASDKAAPTPGSLLWTTATDPVSDAQAANVNDGDLWMDMNGKMVVLNMRSGDNWLTIASKPKPAPVAPLAPTNVTAVAGNAEATVSFNLSNGATSYTVTASKGQTATGSSSPIKVAGLVNGTGVTFTVTANNEAGSSRPSTASDEVTPTVAGSSAPEPPTNLQVSVATTSAGVSWTATSGMVAVEGYELSLDSGAWVDCGNTTSYTISNLTPGQTYAVSVRSYASGDIKSQSALSGSFTTTATTTIPEYPADVLSLTYWKITRPVDAEGNLGNTNLASEIKQPALDTYTDKYFYVNQTGDGVVFAPPADGATTSGSGSARSELREMSNDTDGASWGVDDGEVHTLIITQAVTRLPIKKPQVVCGQIHGVGTADMLIIMANGFKPATGTVAVTDTSTTPFRISYKWDSVEKSTDILPSYTLGQKFTIKIVAANNTVKIYADLGVTATTLRETIVNVTSTFPNEGSSGCYFKAGCYLQTNSTNEGRTVPSNSAEGGADLTSPVAGSTIPGEADGVTGDVVIYDLQLIHGPEQPTNDIQAPSTPANLTTISTSTSINLSWDASTDNVGVVGYEVSSNGENWTSLGTTTSYMFSGLTPSVAYSLSVRALDAAGNKSATASVNAATSASGSIPQYPADVLPLTNWKITLPINTSGALGNGSGSPKEVKQPDLDTYKHDSYFYVNGANDGVVFVAPCNGATTSNSSYPRSELREMANSGVDNASWGVDDGKTHTMAITQSVDQLPIAKPQVACGQIHDANDDMIEILANGFRPTTGTTAVTGISSSPYTIGYRWNGSEQPTPILTNYTRGDIFTVKIEIALNTLKIYADAGTSATTLRATQSNITSTFSADGSSGCYFKAGSYTQSNSTNLDKNVPSGTCAGGANLTSPIAGAPMGGDSDTANGTVTIYDLSISHN